MKINEEFKDLIDELTEKEWEDWCLSWFDKDFFTETYNNWEDETKLEEIENLKEIIKNRK
uniref:Uncharacterized protein n=1 Tax=viral metagenome TaxID=1070528 RepID=A0A6M3LNG5_9ZZZZ